MPVACGGNAFEAGPGDGGLVEDSASVVDSTAGDGPIEGQADASHDGPIGVDGSEGDAVAPPPADGGLVVTGTVLDQYLMPMAGLEVHAQSQKTTSAPDGTFTLGGLTSPYTLTVVTPAVAGHRHGYVFENISRKNPTLQLTADTASQAQSTTASGHLAANAPAASGIVFADLPATAPAAIGNSIPITSGASTYSGPLAWYGPPSVTATMYTLQWFSTNGLPTGYIAYASQSETLTAGTALDWDTPSSSTIMSQATLAVSLGVSSGYVPTAIGLYARPQGAQIAAPIASVSASVPSSQTFDTPRISGMTFVACGVQAPAGTDAGPGAAFGAACNTGLAADATTTLALPNAPTLISPPASATIGTAFSFQPVSSGVYIVAFAPAGNSPGDALYVITNDSQVKVPDLSAFGFQVPSGATYAVEIYAFTPFLGTLTIDSALTATGFSSMATDLRLDRGPLASGQVASSGVATFVVQ